MKIILFDLDGTLINIDERLKHLQKTPRDWEKHHSDYHLDKPIKNMVTLYKMLSSYNEDNMIVRIFLTARIAEERGVTEQWLFDHGLKYDKLVMRAPGDYRDDCVFKEEVVQKWLDAEHEILFVFEDRKRVVDMYRRLGITCLQVADGDF